MIRSIRWWDFDHWVFIAKRLVYLCMFKSLWAVQRRAAHQGVFDLWSLFEVVIILWHLPCLKSYHLFSRYWIPHIQLDGGYDLLLHSDAGTFDLRLQSHVIEDIYWYRTLWGSIAEPSWADVHPPVGHLHLSLISKWPVGSIYRSYRSPSLEIVLYMMVGLIKWQSNHVSTFSFFPIDLYIMALRTYLPAVFDRPG